jgi:transposase-like protein
MKHQSIAIAFALQLVRQGASIREACKRAGVTPSGLYLARRREGMPLLQRGPKKAPAS